MKILKILAILIIIVFLILGIALLCLSIFVKNFDIKEYKPQIIEQISEAIGRDVSIDEINLSFSIENGLFLIINDFRILDNPNFSKTDFLSVKQAQLGIALIPIIRERQVFVSHIKFIEPRIFIIRNAQGVFNVQTFQAFEVDRKQKKQVISRKKGGLLSKTVMGAALPAFLIRHIDIEDGNLIFFDRENNSEKILELSKINFKISNFSLISPFDFSIQAAIFSNQENIDVSGKSKIDFVKSTVYLRDLSAKINLSSMDLNKIYQAIPDVKKMGIKNNLQGFLGCDVDVMEVGLRSVKIAHLKGRLVNGLISVDRLLEPLKDIMLSFYIKDEDFVIDDMSSCSVGSGKISIQGKISDYQTSQRYNLSLKIKDINLKQVFDQSDQDIALLGILSNSVQIQGQGLQSLLSFQPREGKQKLTIKEGKLTNINVLKIILDKVSMIPNLVENLEENLSKKYKEKLKQDDTLLNDVKVDVHIENQRIYIDNVKVVADVFGLSGDGVLDFDLNCQIQAHAFIPEDLSKNMIEAAGELSFLEDDNNRIMIPINIRGQIPDHLIYFPDLEYLGKRVIRRRGKQELQKLLNKVLNRDDESESESNSKQEGFNQQQEPSVEEKIITNVLDAIFN